MSENIAEVIQLDNNNTHVHPQADTLSIVKVGGWTVCIKTEEWIGVNRAIYILPDTIVNPQHDEFSFLQKTGLIKDNSSTYRVKARKLRGISSFGFLIPIPNKFQDVNIGDNLWEKLELTKYNIPEPKGDNAECVRAPSRDFSKYDVENIKNAKYKNLFVDGETVFIFEKVNGQNCRICLQDNELYVGSRSYWKKDTEGSDFWKSFRASPGLETLVRTHPHFCIFGESYGNVGSFKYDCVVGERKFAAFDIYDMSTNKWLDPLDLLLFCGKYEVPTCPLLYRGPFNFDIVLSLAEGKTMLGQAHVREGCVVSPEFERNDMYLGRVKAKCVGLGYLEKS